MCSFAMSSFLMPGEAYSVSYEVNVAFRQGASLCRYAQLAQTAPCCDNFVVNSNTW
jgi:hypothetical protein